ncbi:MAG: hypothetical protein P1V51_07165 [Deltaproteobacteria bacterium]|nr:hypothetical protein [Deltaproteobacteria bacterium]
MRRLSFCVAALAALSLSTTALAQTTTDPLGGTVDTASDGDTTDSWADEGTASEPESEATGGTETGEAPSMNPLGESAPTASTTVVPEVKDETPPQPEDRTGSFGVGVEGTMGFRLAPATESTGGSEHTLRLPALSLVYPASALFHFQVLAGAVLALGSGSPATVQLGLTLRGIYLGLILSRTVYLTIPFGLGYTITRGPDFSGLSTTAHYFHLEAGLRPEWFVTKFFSIHTQAGAVISLLTGNQAFSGGPTYDPGVGLNLFANTDLMAQAGFTVWFN